MQIVIDIPNVPMKDYFDLFYKIHGMAASEGLFDDKKKSQRALALKAVLDILSGIVKGTPLPKGHWIDVDGDNAICGCCNRLNHLYGTYCEHCCANMIEPQESGEAQPKQTEDSCLDFDLHKVIEILKRDDFDNLFVDHTCEEKQEQTRDEKMIDTIDFAIKATDSQDDYSMGIRNGMRYVKSFIDGKEPQYESRRTDEEIKLGIDLGDEVVGDYGAKGVVVGMDTYKGEVLLSLLMRNHKVPQLVKASGYKTKTSRHFSQIIEVLEQIKGETDGK